MLNTFLDVNVMIKENRVIIAIVLSVALVISSYVYTAKASVLFQDGFESGNFNAWDWSNGQISSAYAKTGSYSAKFTGWSYYTQKSLSGYNQLYMGCYAMVPSLPENNNEIAFLFFFDDSWSKHSAVGYVNDNGNYGLQLHQMAPNDYYRGHYFNLQAYQWNWVVLECLIATQGEVRVWLNDVQVMNITNINTSSWNLNLQLFGPQYQDSQQKTVYLDNCIISTTYPSAPAPSPTPSATPTASPTPIPTPTSIPTPTPTASPTPTPTPSVTPSPTPTPSPSPSPTPSPTPNPTPIPTATPTPTSTQPMETALKVDGNITITGADLRRASSTTYNFYITIVKNGTNHITLEIAKTILPQVSYLRVYINNTNKPYTFIDQGDKWIIEIVTT